MRLRETLASLFGGLGGLVGKEAREEETGARVGTVSRVEKRGGRASSYAIKRRDGSSETLDSEQAYETPEGLVILPEWYVDGWTRVEEARATLGADGRDVVGGRMPLGSSRAAGAAGSARELRDELSGLHFRYTVTAQKLRARASDLQSKRMLEEITREELVRELESLQRRARLNKMMLERCQELIDALDGILPGGAPGPGSVEPEAIADALGEGESEEDARGPPVLDDEAPAARRSAPGRPLAPDVPGARGAGSR
jgi:hypothetical protein